MNVDVINQELGDPFRRPVCGPTEDKEQTGTEARAFRSGPMSRHPERSPAWNLGPKSAREENMNNYRVYCLYTKIEGIFSLGYGKAAHNDRKSWVSGTASEWKQQPTKTLHTSMKWSYI